MRYFNFFFSCIIPENFITHKITQFSLGIFRDRGRDRDTYFSFLLHSKITQVIILIKIN